MFVQAQPAKEKSIFFILIALSIRYNRNLYVLVLVQSKLVCFSTHTIEKLFVCQGVAGCEKLRRSQYTLLLDPPYIPPGEPNSPPPMGRWFRWFSTRRALGHLR